MKLKILSIIGARPQFIKAAVFRKTCKEFDIIEKLVHTGQHYDSNMSTDIFRELGIKEPDIKLNIVKRSHSGMTAEMLLALENCIINEKPDIVNVYGDTNSTLAGALAAAKLNVPIMHIESGMRSFNKKMPEEVNRILTDHISSYLFCSTKTAVQNLKNENLSEGIFHVGDIMFEAIKVFKPFFKFPSYLKNNLSKQIAVLTIHRADTLSNPKRLKKIIKYSEQYSKNYDIIFPVHPNTRLKLKNYNISTGKIQVSEPLGYTEMQGLLDETTLVLTDSGGLQKEAYFHGCDCITLRDETEWIETVKCGWNKLWTSNERILKKTHINDYGIGDTSKKILKAILA